MTLHQQLHQAHLARRARFDLPHPLRVPTKQPAFAHPAPSPGNIDNAVDEDAETEREVLLPANNRASNVKIIQRAVAHHFGLTRSALLSPTHRKAVAVPRQVAMFLVRAEMGLSLDQIGHHFGGRHHTTVLSGLKKVERLRVELPQMQNDIDLCIASLRGDVVHPSEAAE